MVATTAIIAFVVHEWPGVAIVKASWTSIFFGW
jgi:hypothetical protein